MIVPQDSNTQYFQQAMGAQLAERTAPLPAVYASENGSLGETKRVHSGRKSLATPAEKADQKLESDLSQLINAKGVPKYLHDIANKQSEVSHRKLSKTEAVDIYITLYILGGAMTLSYVGIGYLLWKNRK